jgi:very-short-patch-repair endonuclease
VARHAPFDSEFERQVHDVIVANGYEVDGQVGCGGYRVDLAVVHPNKPGEYLLGVECDGAPYHSAATARDRDRLRQQVLAGLGWRLHRVWSTDWWLDRDQEIARLKQAIAEALAAPDVDEAVPSPPPATAVLAPSGLLMAAPAVSPASGGTPVLQTVAPPATQPPVEPYVLAVLDPVSIDPESMYSPAATVLIAARVSETIRCEAPLHVDELCRRVASCWGISRLTDRVRQRIGKEIKHAAAQKSLLVQEDFVWAAGADPLGHSTFRGPNPGDAACDVDLIALEELAVAVKWVLTHSFSLDEASLARESARLFGLTRMGRKVDQRFSAAIALVIQRGFAARDGDRIVARS